MRPLVLLALAVVVLGHPQPSTAQTPSSSPRITPLVRAIQNALPAVVAIRSQRHLRTVSGPGSLGQPQQIEGMGAGVILHRDGFILTNHHVVAAVERIYVTLSDGRTFEAQRLGSDPQADLAVLRIRTPSPLPEVPLGSSHDLMLGEPVLAIGNPFGYDHTITRGIISALGRRVQVNEELIYPDLIQTDAAINPGNSGGPLINAEGKMIGLTVAVRVGAQGIGFAIPVNRALQVAAQILQRWRPVRHGIRLHWSVEAEAWVVGAVLPGSPAQNASLRPGDQILRVNGQPTSNPVSLQLALLQSPQRSVRLQVQRAGESVQMLLNLPPGPETEDLAWELLGLKLEPIGQEVLKKWQVPYRGGLRVAQVRQGSPAQRQGLRVGDILVGIHIWETLLPEHVRYILNRPDLEKLQPLKFYVIRQGETFYGHLQVE